MLGPANTYKALSPEGPDLAVCGGSGVEGPPQVETECLLPGVGQHGGEGPAAPVDPGVGRGHDGVKVLAATDQEATGQVVGGPTLGGDRHVRQGGGAGVPWSEHLGVSQEPRGGRATNNQDVVFRSDILANLKWIGLA